MNKYILFIFSFLNFFSKEPEYETLSKKIIEDYRKEVLEPNGLFIYGLGGSSDEGGIKTINITVAKLGPGSLKEGRKLLLFLVDDLLKRYNDDIDMRKFLINYPFTPTHLAYGISYMKPTGRSWVFDKEKNQEDQIALIDVFSEKISYNIKLSDKIEPFVEIHSETYEEAKKIVDDENDKSSR